MSVQQLMIEASRLSPAERRELIGLLIREGRKQPEGYWDRLAAKIEDGDPAHWVAENDLDRALHLDGTAE